MKNENRIEEIAQAFINGNISWCKAKLYGNHKLKCDVYNYLLENASKCVAKSYLVELIIKGK